MAKDHRYKCPIDGMEYLQLTFLLTPPVHVVYNACMAPLGVAFVVLLLSPRRLQCQHAWSLGSCARRRRRRFTHANLFLLTPC